MKYFDLVPDSSGTSSTFKVPHKVFYFLQIRMNNETLISRYDFHNFVLPPTQLKARELTYVTNSLRQALVRNNKILVFTNPSTRVVGTYTHRLRRDCIGTLMTIKEFVNDFQV